MQIKTLMLGTVLTSGAALLSLQHQPVPPQHTIAAMAPAPIRAAPAAAPGHVHHIVKSVHHTAKLIARSKHPTVAPQPTLAAKRKTKRKPYFVVDTQKHDNAL